MNKVVVIGGGIAGLLSSLILKKNGFDVTIIEKDTECGGLLKSFTNEDGVFFDYGTHFIRETGIKELDDIVFKDLDRQNWNYIERLRPGNYFSGHIYQESQIIYTPHLPEHLYEKGLVELMHTPEQAGPHENLEEVFLDQFGKTYTEVIYAPLMKKLLGLEPKELHPQAHLLFGYAKLICANRFLSKELKKSEFLNGKLAFASDTDAPSRFMNFYPKEGGIGQWAQLLVQQALAAGVHILNGESLESFDIRNGTVTAVQLESGRSVEVDQLIWTVPPIFFIQKAKFAYSSTPAKFRTMTLLHYVLDQPFLIDNHFFYCNDANMLSFRITLYSNVTLDEVKAPYHCTVEVLSDGNESDVELNEKVLRELHEMGLIAKNTNVLYKNIQRVRSAIPIFTREFVQSQKEQVDIIKSRTNNVMLLGKSAGNNFFFDDVLRETYHTLNTMTPNGKA